MGTNDWRQRFRAPQIWLGAEAGQRPERGLVVASQDGQTIQLFAWDVPEGRISPLTDAPFGVLDGWLDPTGSHVYYLRDEDGTEHGHIVRVPFTGGEPEDVTPNLAPYTLRGVGFNAAGDLMAFNPVNEDGFGLYVMEVGTTVGEPRLIHQDTWETWGAVLSARGDLAACYSTARAKGARRYTVLVFDTRTGEQVAELDDGSDASVVAVCFSPVDGDDRLLARTNRGEYVRPVIWDPRSGSRTDLELPELDGDAVPADWSFDARQVLICQMSGAQRLSTFDLSTQQLRQLEHPQGTYFNPIDGGIHFDGQGNLVGLWTNAVTPPAVVELDGETGGLRRELLTSGDAPRGRPWRSVTFPSGDGTPVQAWVATPEGDGPFPTILETHGGPHYATYEGYDAGAQCWLDNGYAWMSVNYRGSTGFGRRFLEQIWGDLGRWELTDMVAAREWLVAEGIANPDEVFVHGASYGGFLTLYALGKSPDLWAGGLALVADADMAAAYEDASPALKAAVAAWMLGTPDERPEAYAAASPITYAADVAAPVLVIQARNDTRVPPKQMENYEQKMRSLGKDIEVIWYDGGHQSIGPEVMVQWYEAMLEFADRTLARKRSRA
ncbi:MAG TPA: prolyl oligopeptidase family serine peptidase [Micromonosporaceae bacterium]|nr:prolyl oligopeptidase family serine peptidase [Micromonosporaceae bacterium]